MSTSSVMSLPDYSTAGFHKVPGMNREVYNFNPGWRFLKGDGAEQPGWEQPDFDDSDWLAVNAPHGLELLPESASGTINYQGPAWYRKRFTLPREEKGRRLILHFEGVMGRTKIWLNGELLTEHFGGYLPIIVDISDKADFNGENVIALMTDNSNDHDIPPGKPQEHLDFCYFGGLYRDVWLISTGNCFITDGNEENITAGGGVFLHYGPAGQKGEESAKAKIRIHLRNTSNRETNGTIRLKYSPADSSDAAPPFAETTIPFALAGDSAETFETEILLKNPRWWTPDDPFLYNLHISLEDESGRILDGYRLKTGIRYFEFRRGLQGGFYLNGKKFSDKLIGGNRHQEFALIGNALPNSLHWRDAVKLKEASMRVIRCAHYPQDPSFMDACDALGLFVIIATPGWQLWNHEPVFRKRVMSDIRNMVRRDRNRPSAFLWEPILNETRYPADFAKEAHDTVNEEYPYPGCYTASDDHAEGQEHFDIVYSHPFKRFFWKKYWPDTPENKREVGYDYEGDDRCVFTREWGDSVDNFDRDHNSPSRMARSWGEQPQLFQALHYVATPHLATSWESLYDTPDQHVGGTMWHSFDHNRGYHPDPFWGGLMDAWRRPKYSWYQFKSQSDRDPFLFMANELSPVSPRDIVIFSNCETVRLYRGEELRGEKSTTTGKMPHCPVVFEDAWNFYTQRIDTRPFIMEGLNEGKTVARKEIFPVGRREEILLEADYAGVPLSADGSDMVVVTARFIDRHDRTKRLTEEFLRFSVSGAGEIVDDGRIGVNPQKLQWGEASILIRTKGEPGRICIDCEALNPGTNTPLPARLEIATEPALFPSLGENNPSPFRSWPDMTGETKKALWQKNRDQQEEMQEKYGEIGKQQDDFA